MRSYEKMRSYCYDSDAWNRRLAKDVVGLGVACIAVALILLALMYAAVCSGLDANSAIPEYRYRQMKGLILVNLLGIAAMGCGLIHERHYYLDKIESPKPGNRR